MNGDSIFTDSQVVRDARTGCPRKIRNNFELPVAGTAEDSVKTFLLANAEELGLGMQRDDLQPIKVVTTPTGAVYRFQQYKDNIPVFGTEILVRLGTSKRVRQLNLEHVSPIRVAAPVGNSELTPEASIKAASQAIGGQVLRENVDRPTKIYFPTAEGLKLSYMMMILTMNPDNQWRVIVDAYNGQLLYKEDMRLEDDGEGFVFDPNPIVTSENANLRDPEATTQVCGFTGSQRQDIDAQRFTRPLNGIKKSGTTYLLEGEYVKLVNIASESIAPPQETNLNNFKYSSGDDSFGDVNVYYHVDTIQRYIQSLGITNVMNTQIPADAHYGSGGAAYYYPTTNYPNGYLAFGQSEETDQYGQVVINERCRPDCCQDADAILHEYGHAIQRNQVPTWGGVSTNDWKETDAMGEGFGDILACVYFAPNHPFQREVFEDWRYADVGGLRQVNGTKVYPKDWKNLKSDDGEIWSAALWNIYRAIGGDNTTDISVRLAARDELLKTLILSHFHVAGNATMPDGAEEFMNENADLPEYRLQHGIEMLNSFHDRGILHCETGSNLQIIDLWSQQAEFPVSSWQQVEYGQDNWFYARVRNDGNVTVRAAVVTFSFQAPYFTPVYPEDWRNKIKSAAIIYDLTPGDTRTVKALFPAKEIPTIPTDSDHLHGCILAEVYNPMDHVPTGCTTLSGGQGKLFQRNTDVVDASPGDKLDYQLFISNYYIQQEQLVQLEVVRPKDWEKTEIWFGHKESHVIEGLWEKAGELESLANQPDEEIISSGPEILILDPTRIMLGAGGDAPNLVLNLARGSTLMVPKEEATERLRRGAEGKELFRRRVELVKERGETRMKLISGRKAGFTYTMLPRERNMLDVHFKVPAEAKPGDQLKYEVVQRNDKGEVIGGFDVLVNVVAK